MIASIVVVSYNSQDLIAACLKTLSQVARDASEIVVIDNASTDRSVDAIREAGVDVRLVCSPQNLGFGGGVNLALRTLEADVIVVLNPDVTLQDGTLRALTEVLAADARAAVAGGKLLYPDGRTIQHAGGKIHYPLALSDHYGYGEEDRGQYDQVREVDYVTGAAFAIKKAVLAEVGSFDEGFYPAYFEETDLCYRVRQAGYKVLYVPRAVAIHHESVTTGKDTFRYYHLYHRNRIRFVLKHDAPEQLWRDFLPAEVARLRGALSVDELRALQLAYRDNLAVLEGRETFFANPAAVAPLPTGANQTLLLWLLEGSATRALAGSGKGGVMPSFEGTGAGRYLASLLGRRQLTEPRFTSVVPLVGPLIARGRELWNSVSTKWYVRPILQQQNEVNELTTEMLRELAEFEQQARAALRDLNERTRVLETSVVETERLVTRLNRDITRLGRARSLPPASDGSSAGNAETASAP